MKRTVILMAIAMIAAVAFAGSVWAAPPCNDTNGDGSSSGREYAHYHIAELARVGDLGEGGHKPGSHRGYSVCNPSGGTYAGIQGSHAAPSEPAGFWTPLWNFLSLRLR